MNILTKIPEKSRIGYVGIYDDYKYWHVSVRCNVGEIANYTYNRSPSGLSNYLSTTYTTALFRVAYMGRIAKCGPQREFSELGLECIVVNPGIISELNDDQEYLNNSEIVSKLSKAFQDNRGMGLKEQNTFWQSASAIVHKRIQHIMELKKAKSDLIHFLDIHQIQLLIEADIIKWSHKLEASLKLIELDSPELKATFDACVEKVHTQKAALLSSDKSIKKLADYPEIKLLREHLEALPFIGLIRAVSIIIEVQDIKCFQSLDDLCFYSGVPIGSRAGDRSRRKDKILPNTNHYLFKIIFQTSRDMIKRDSDMRSKYNMYCKKVSKREALFKISHLLLRRIWDAWSNMV